MKYTFSENKIELIAESWKRLCIPAFSSSMPLLFILLASPLLQGEISSDILTSAMRSPDAPLVIDLRSTDEFTRGHIPGAINISHRLLGYRKLPKLDRVVIYGDGLGRIDARNAAATLNAKYPHLTVQVLNGGYAGWKTERGLTTEMPGAGDHTSSVISYQNLVAMNSDNIVLIDLIDSDSKKDDSNNRTAKTQSQISSEAVSNLSRLLPGVPVRKSPFEVMSASHNESNVAQRATSPQSKNGPPLLVLIDRNDGKAEEAARKLRAQGYHRYVVLMGGEEIINRKGKSGLRRKSTIISPETVKRLHSESKEG